MQLPKGRLVFSRKTGESFVVGDTTVTVKRLYPSRAVNAEVQVPGKPLETHSLADERPLHLPGDVAITATVPLQRGDRINVSVEAPKNIKILRSELISGKREV